MRNNIFFWTKGTIVFYSITKTSVSLARQAYNLMANATQDQVCTIRELVSEVTCRWDDLNKSISKKQKELEQALLQLGQFQHALNELLVWIKQTDQTLEALKPILGDLQTIEVELAKLKVKHNRLFYGHVELRN